MSDAPDPGHGEAPPPPPGLAEIPGLVRAIIDRLIDLGTIRLQLAQAELREEAQQRLRRVIFVVIPASFLLMGLGLINLGILFWLASLMGNTAAAFLLAAIYLVLGAAGILWFVKTGGLNPPGADPEKKS